jgi:hypothetical protein
MFFKKLFPPGDTGEAKALKTHDLTEYVTTVPLSREETHGSFRSPDVFTFSKDQNL